MSIGAILGSNGCNFKVWAPNAKDVHVIGEFNNWSKDVNKLHYSSDGYWCGTIPNANAKQKYSYIIVSNSENEYVDPAARDTIHSGTISNGNKGIIVDSLYNWNEFKTPNFENFIIYQLHIGTFAGFSDEFKDECFDKVAKIKYIKDKFSYIKSMGFNAIELLPIGEFLGDHSMGYNTSFFFAPESAYGTSEEYKDFVNEAHKNGLAVIFDVVYNHASTNDNSLWGYDAPDGIDGAKGIYLSDYQETGFGSSFAFWKQQVKDFFLDNCRMYFNEYKADGLRFDATRRIEDNVGSYNAGDGWKFMQYLTYMIKKDFPDKYIIAEHLPDHDTIIRDAGFHATWFADSHHEFERAVNGQDPINKLKGFIGKDFGFGKNYENQWNLVKYLLGSHDECKDINKGKDINNGNENDHRFLVELLGGRENEYAKSKVRLGWALNIAIPGTPLMFQGTECHHYGYWSDNDDQYGDHRFNWQIAGDSIGMPMRRLVSAANWVRWNNPALRSETLEYTHEDYTNNVLAFKRWIPDGNNVILTIVNMSDTNFENHCYGVCTNGQYGQWTQILCSQDVQYGGWDNSGNAYYEPHTQDDGKIYISLPRWSVIMMKLL